MWGSEMGATGLSIVRVTGSLAPILWLAALRLEQWLLG